MVATEIELQAALRAIAAQWEAIAPEPAVDGDGTPREDGPPWSVAELGAILQVGEVDLLVAWLRRLGMQARRAGTPIERVSAMMAEVAAAVGVRLGPAELDGDSTFVVGADPTALGEVLDLVPVEGSLADLAAAGEQGIAVVERVAEERGLAVGDRIPAVFPSSGPVELTVAMVYEQNLPEGDWLLPLEAREAGGDEIEPIERIGLLDATPSAPEVVRRVTALEQARRVARDVAGTEPERMSPARVVELCRAAFRGTPVGVDVVEERVAIERGYPLIAAVARASYVAAKKSSRSRPETSAATA